MMPRFIDNSESDRMGRAILEYLGVDQSTVKSGSVRWEISGDSARVEWDGIAAPDPDELLAVINGLGLKVRQGE